MTTIQRAYGAIPIARGVTGLEVLLVQQKDGDGEQVHWSFPKGHKEEGETVTEAVLREIKEETGLTINEGVFVFEPLEYTYTFLREDGMVRKINTLFPIFIDHTLDLSPEASDVHQARWANISTAKTLMKYNTADEFLEEVKVWIAEHAPEEN